MDKAQTLSPHFMLGNQCKHGNWPSNSLALQRPMALGRGPWEKSSAVIIHGMVRGNGKEDHKSEGGHNREVGHPVDHFLYVTKKLLYKMA
ncbi:GL18108 [Drosophila persimilis]|uniref:GL18108 n=1 Tax=Drosophila persimilis TaxID=7234 RepID=B4IS45_DROPE|nr:GL18108 [Drosophila persimilis]